MVSEPEQTEDAHPVDPSLVERPPVPTAVERLRMFDQQRLAPAAFVAMVALTVVGLVYVFQWFVHDLIIAFILVALFHPLWQWLTKKLGNRPWVASSLVTALLIVVLAVPLGVLAVGVGQQSTQVLDAGRVFLASDAADERVFNQVNGHLNALGMKLSRDDVAGIVVRLQDYLRDLLLTSVGSVVAASLAIILHLAVVFVAVFYLLVDGVRFKAFVFELSPLPDEEDELIITQFQQVTWGILMGNGLGSVIQALLAGAAMWLAGLPGVLFWIAVMSVLAFLPLVGISMVTIPASAYLFLIGRPGVALLFFLFCTTVSLYVDSIVKAWLIGARTRMHDLLVFLSIVGGIAAFGIMGLLYGPLLVAAFLTLTTLYLQTYHQKLASSWRRPLEHPIRRSRL